MSRLEAELLDVGGDLTAALEEVGLPAALLATDGTIRWQNRASIALRGDHVGSDFAALIAPGERPDARSLITRLVCSGEPAEATLQILNASGEYVPVQLSAVPIRDGGAVVAIFGLSHAADPLASAAPPSPGIDLTPRQHEVLRLLADGRSTDEIAAQLSLSQTTVRNHIASLLAALGVHSRLQAVVAAGKARLLER